MPSTTCEKLTFCFSAIGNFFFPQDRPSPLFSILIQLICSSAVTLGFKVVLSEKCSYRNVQAIALGIMNHLVNMIFAVTIIVITRRSIFRGVSRSQSAFRLFLCHPIVMLFLLFGVWEVSYILWSASVQVEDACSSAVNGIVVLLGCTILIGFILFILTFSTECCRLPRWREAAHSKWERAHSNWNMDMIHSSARASAEEPVEEEEEERANRGPATRRS